MIDPAARLPSRSDVDAVVLDVGGVLLLPHKDALSPAFTAAGVDPPDDGDGWARAHYSGMARFDEHCVDAEDWSFYLDGFLDTLAVTGPARNLMLHALDRAFQAPSHEVWIDVVTTSLEAGRRFNAAGIPVAIVSNADGNIASALHQRAVAQVGAGAGVELVALIDSTIVGVAKPDPAIFAHALDPLGVAPGRCVYVGDSVRNDVGGARAAGLLPVQLDPFHNRPDASHPRITSLLDLADALGA